MYKNGNCKKKKKQRERQRKDSGIQKCQPNE